MREEPYKSGRITVIETPEMLEILISGKIPGWQFNALTLWQLAWTVAGLFVISQLFFGVAADQKVFMYIWLAFWIYFEVKIGHAWLWRKSGKEIIKIAKDTTELRFEVPLRTRASKFKTQEINGVSNLEIVKGVFAKNYYESFWVVGGETIGLQYHEKLYSFGRQLPPEDAARLMRIVEKRLKAAKTGKL